MRRLLIGALVVAATLAVAAPAPAATIGVSIFARSFTPSTITLNADDAITWTNKDKTDHQVVANDGSFASPILSPGKSYTFTFKRGGTFHYHDAYRTATKGTITVKGPPPSLTFVLSQPIVVYGTQITLSGKVSSNKANESVEIDAQQYGQPSPVQLAIVKTGSDGSFAYTVTPELYTTYTAHWGNVTAGSLLAQVAPKVQLLAGGKGYFKAMVTAGRSFAGKHVSLQRLNAFGQWLNIASLTLGSQGGKIFQARSYLPKGLSHIRVFLSVNQAGLGLLSSYSGEQTFRR
jgi:plastocyanin